MKILVAFERSGMVTGELRARGHEAYSCDLAPCDDPEYPYHLQQDALPLLKEPWDMIIAFPPCTHLAVSGARHFAAKRADGRQQQGIDLFMACVNANAPAIAIENPVGIMSTRYRKPDQTIQPYEYGHPESKRTCLWLTGLPLLEPTNILPKPVAGYWQNQTPSGQNKLGPSPTRADTRSRTYFGIAQAMAQQWAGENHE